MKKRGIISISREYGEKIAEKLGYDLVDVEYIKEHGNYFLRVYIDKKGGVGLDDCQIFTEKLSNVLDDYDPVEEAYYLEVSSPGLDRPLKTDRDFERNLGKEVELRFYKNFKDRKQLEGILDSFNDEYFYILENEKILEIPRDIVSLMRLVIKF